MAHVLNPDQEQGTYDQEIVAERILRALKANGVKYLFANLGSDHPGFIEAFEHVRAAGDHDAIPEVIVCPHEFAAMSAAHGYASVTGQPQAVLVHVDVGTQNLGAAFHNAHRDEAPVFVIAGLAPITHEGQRGARDSVVHYLQDVFDQGGIHREYSRWVREYRAPADPTEYVVRGLERAMSPPGGPVYLSATREALATPIDETNAGFEGSPRQIEGPVANQSAIESVAEQIEAADHPAVITSRLGRPPNADDRVETLVEFAETAGAAVVEHAPNAVSFPRDHDLHLGFEPSITFDDADLILMANVDIPWAHINGTPNEDTTIIQIDIDPTKQEFPQWPFVPDETVYADPVPTLAAITAELDPAAGESGRAFWSERAADRRDDVADRLATAQADDTMTPDVLGAALADVLDERTVIVDDAVTSSGMLKDQIEADRAGSYVTVSGTGLGWGVASAIGVKLAQPDQRVISVVGDGGYLFSNPTTCAWIAADNNAPTLTVVIDNSGWNAVEHATRAEYPTGDAAGANVTESQFTVPCDLTVPAQSVGAHTARVSSADELAAGLDDALTAIDNGTPAVLVVDVERI